MTRRAFLAAPFLISESRTREGFIFTGHLTLGGQPGEGYYSVGQLVSVNIHPEAKAMIAGADALLNAQVEVSLVRAK